MLAQQYQDYIRAMIAVAGAEVKATGKFKSGTIKKHASVVTAAQASYDYTKGAAAMKHAETAKYVNGEIVKSTLAQIKAVHKTLKKQGLVMLPAAVVPGVAVAHATDATTTIDRRALLAPNAAQAGDKAYWSAMTGDLKSFVIPEW